MSDEALTTPRVEEAYCSDFNILLGLLAKIGLTCQQETVVRFKGTEFPQWSLVSGEVVGTDREVVRLSAWIKQKSSSTLHGVAHFEFSPTGELVDFKVYVV
jgi:hypothetical protein